MKTSQFFSRNRKPFKLLSLFLFYALMSLVAITACKKDEPPAPTSAPAPAPAPTPAPTPSGVTITDGEAAATDFDLSINGTKTLAATVTPAGASQDVTWSSGDDAIAIVDAAGVVTAKAVGKTAITATSKSASSAKASVNVTVYDAATKITIRDPDDKEVGARLTLDFARTYVFTATVEPAGASEDVVWTTSNKDTISVEAASIPAEDGKTNKVAIIKTKNAGTSTITATSKTNPDIKASVKITVDAIVIIKEVQARGDAKDDYKGARADGATFVMKIKDKKTFKAFLASDTINAVTDIKWESNKPAAVSVTTAGEIEALGLAYDQPVTITAKSTIGTAREASFKVRVAPFTQSMKGYLTRTDQELAGDIPVPADLTKIVGLSAKVKEDWGIYYTTLFTKEGKPVNFSEDLKGKTTFDCWAIFVARSYVLNSTRTSGVQIEITLEGGKLKAKALQAEYTYKYWHYTPENFNFDIHGKPKDLATQDGESGYAALDLTVAFK